MFSVAQKQQIAGAVEQVLLSFKHPEMPTEKPKFTLRVYGKKDWSWAEITPNWTFNKENPPSINPHNEQRGSDAEETILQ